MENNSMSDRDMMENLLINTKSACDMYLHGVEESSTPQVRQAFQCALTESLEMQNTIYTKMADKGWYPTETAEQKQINKVVKQFAPKN